MALGTPVLLGTYSSNTTSNVAFDITLSRAIAPNALAVVVVQLNRNGAAPSAPTSVSGGGVTWETLATNTYDSSGYAAGVYAFRAQGASPSGTTITVTPPSLSALINTQALVVEFPDATVGSNGATAIVQNQVPTFGSGSIGVAREQAMSTLTDTTNNGFFVVIGGTITSASAVFTPDTSPVVTELYDANSLQSGNGVVLFAGYALSVTDTNPSVGATIAGATHNSGGMIALEISGTSSGGGPSNTPRSMFYHLQGMR